MTARHWSAGFLGVPFADRGRTRAGCDCWGLVRLAFLEVRGITLPDLSAGYESTARIDQTAAVVAAETAEGGLWSAVERPAEWDVVLLCGRRGQPTHCGVMVDRQRFLHVEKDPGAADIERLGAAWIAPRVCGFWRLREEELSHATSAA